MYILKYLIKYTFMLLFIFSLLVLLLLNYNNKLINNYKYISLEESYDILETGDIVLFKWNIEYLLDVKVQITSPFSHCAMIIEIDGEKYIMEKMDLKDYEAFGNIDHRNLIKFKDRVNKYNGKVFCIKRKNKMTDKEKEKLYNKFHDYMSIEFRDNYPNHMLYNCIFKLNKEYNKDVMYCSEYLSYLLNDIGSINNSINHSCTTPYDIFNLSLFDKSSYYRIK